MPRTTAAKKSQEAGDAFLGYLYQLRFGLLCALRTRAPDAAIAFELLDDVSLHETTPAGFRRGLHQLKHSLEAKASLGAKSLSVWKTIGGWSQQILDGEVETEECLRFLHTTGTAKRSSPLFFLRSDDNRDTEEARRLLLTAGTSTSKKVKKWYPHFVKLRKDRQLALLETIELVDGEIDIVGLREELEVELSVACHPEHLTTHVRQLEGWLFDVAVATLASKTDRMIPVTRIKAESSRIRDSLVAEALPDEFSDAPVPETAMGEDDERLFVRQLRLISVDQNRIMSAQQDHYRAFAQRGQWSREANLAIDELPRFDDALVDEWSRRHADACSTTTCSHEETGQSVFRWAELEAPDITRLQLRRIFDAPFLIRGSFHVLAERRKLGWHPNWTELLPKKNDEDS